MEYGELDLIDDTDPTEGDFFPLYSTPDDEEWTIGESSSVASDARERSPSLASQASSSEDRGVWSSPTPVKGNH